VFALFRGHQYAHASGIKYRLPCGAADSLEHHVKAFFQGDSVGSGPTVLVGALPFAAQAAAFLFQPRQCRRGAGQGPFGHARDSDAARGWAPFQITACPSPAEYAAMVRQALDMIGRGALSKVVLSRSLRIEAAMPVDPLQVVARLARDGNATTFMMALPVEEHGEPATLVGATPELLVSRSGEQVLSHPLAGSAPRCRDGANDEAMAQGLLRSDKDRREHALVVEAILDILSPYCTSLGTPDGTALYSTATMWHLGTRIEGLLKRDAPSSAGLAALLHPTPAVGGSPRAAALDAIRAIEPHDRGFYAGAIGWTDAQGDGEWHVTLRCAEICGARLTLRAGAGIVAGSSPDDEVAETRAKFRAMLSAIEMEEARDFLEAVS